MKVFTDCYFFQNYSLKYIKKIPVSPSLITSISKNKIIILIKKIIVKFFYFIFFTKNKYNHIFIILYFLIFNKDYENHLPILLHIMYTLSYYF